MHTETRINNGLIEFFLAQKESPLEYADFFLELRQALGTLAPHIRCSFTKSFKGNSTAPTAVILGSGLAEEKNPTEILDFIKNYKNTDPSVCIFIADASGKLSGADTLKWMEIGVTGFLAKNFKAKELEDSFKDLLLNRVQNIQNAPDTVPVKHHISIPISSLEQAVVSETLNIGLGGMFVRLSPKEVNFGDLIAFDFKLSKNVSDSSSTFNMNPQVELMNDAPLGTVPGEISGFSGVGSVVWIRNYSDSTGPEGISVQFHEIDPAAKKMIEEFVLRRGPRAFIPKA